MLSDFLSSFGRQGGDDEEDEQNGKKPTSLLPDEDVDDLVSTFVGTNWKSEIVNFGQAVQEETKEAMRSFESLPQKASQVIPGIGSVQQRMENGIAQLAVGAKELFDQSVGVIETEIMSHHPQSTSTAADPTHSARHVKFSRFESEVMAMQRNSSTYCDEPEDLEDFQKWKGSFAVDDHNEAIQKLIGENRFMAELHKRIVPVVVDHDTFWTRYFYRLHKLQEMQDQRQQLAEKALRLQEDETQLPWDDEVSTPSQKEQAASDPEPLPEKSGQRSQQEEKGSSDWSVVDVEPVERIPEKDAQQVTREVRPQKQQPSDEEDDEEIDEDWGEWE